MKNFLLEILMDAAGAEGGAGSAGVPVVKTAPPGDATPPDTNTFDSVIPDAYKEKPYLKDIRARNMDAEGFAEVFKKLDGSQTLIGKSRPPAADAPDAEWEEFHAKMRPESADKYAIKMAEGATPDEAFNKQMQEMFFKAGLSPRQADAIQSTFTEVTGAKYKEAQAAQDAEFEKLSSEVFGDSKEAALKRANALLTKFAPDSMKDHVASLPNKEAVILASVLDGIHREYIKEDTAGGPSSAPGGGTDETALRAEAVAIMRTPAFKSKMDPGHTVAAARVREIYSKFK